MKTMLGISETSFNRNDILMKHNEPHIFFRSQWQTSEGPSLYYLLYRWTMTAYLLGTWLLSVIDPRHIEKSELFKLKWSIYLTNWGYTICLLQALHCTICLTIWIMKRNDNKDSYDQKSHWITKTYKFYWIFNTMATDIAFGITALYWPLIYNEKKNILDTLNITSHGTNSLAMFIELWVVEHPTLFVHVYWPILFGLVYCIFSGLYYAAGGTARSGDTFIYTVLDWRFVGKTLGICFGILVFLVIVHSFSCCIYYLRSYVHKKLRRSHLSMEISKYSQHDFDNSHVSDELV